MLKNFSEIKEIIRTKKGKQETVLMFVNYPQMPTGQLPSKKLFEELVTFAKENQVLLIHDLDQREHETVAYLPRRWRPVLFNPPCDAGPWNTSGGGHFFW